PGFLPARSQIPTFPVGGPMDRGETTKFINPLDIPVEFVEKNVKLRGKLHHITEKGLEIEHIPISIPFFTPKGLLLIRLAGVELAPGATAWLQRELLPTQPLWFQLLGRDSSALNCLVLVHKGGFLSTCLNEELLRQGLARAARIEGLPHHSRLYWKLHKRLLRAELKAVRKKKGIWKEQSYSETLQERITDKVAITKVPQGKKHHLVYQRIGCQESKIFKDNFHLKRKNLCCFFLMVL
uniref:Chromosome 3 open reading frame 33 n=1 Tax=Catharus ustulatus TaxID=91951 RepID=A0A8C3V6S4_CATUS